MWTNVLSPISLNESWRHLSYTCRIVLKNGCWFHILLLDATLLVDYPLNRPQPNTFTCGFMKCKQFGMICGGGRYSLFCGLPRYGSSTFEEYITGLRLAPSRVHSKSGICKTFNLCRIRFLITQPKIGRTFEVSHEVLNSVPMSHCWVLAMPSQNVGCKCNIRPSMYS